MSTSSFEGEHSYMYMYVGYTGTGELCCVTFWWWESMKGDCLSAVDCWFSLLTEFFRLCSDDDRHSEDWHRVLRMDLVQRYICQPAMSGQCQTAHGGIPPVWLQPSSQNIRGTTQLLENAACYWWARLQAVESLEQLRLSLQVEAI